jgi:hypothetical protein
MSKLSIHSSPSPPSRYAQQWGKIITQQWEEVWQMNADRICKAQGLAVNGLDK